MWFSSWLRRPTSHRVPRSRTQHRPASARFRPRLEALEERWVPSQIGLTVTSLADSGAGTLRAAISTADAGSHSDKFMIGFAVTGTVDLQSPLPDLNNNIAIQGPGAASLTVEHAAGASFTSAILTVDAAQSASLSGLTVANGNAGGIDNYGGTLTVSGCTISGNSASFVPGGGIYNAGTLTLTDSTLSGNSAVIGGGIFNAATLEVSGCTLSGNVGGGIFNNGGAATVTGSTFTGNSATAGVGGGGIYNQDGQMTVANSTFSGNSAPGNFSLGGPGGAIFNYGPGAATTTMTVKDCTLSGNSATVGGAIEDSSATLTVSRCTLSGNSATVDGGAINNGYGATLTVSGCMLSGNSAAQGGGIFNQSSLVVRDSLFIGNSAIVTDFFGSSIGGFGGGIYNSVFGALAVSGNTFSGNMASESGGGIYNAGRATVRGSTLSGNTAGSEGGGIFNDAAGMLAVDDSTVSGNTATGEGGGIYNAGALTVSDSVFSGNIPDNIYGFYTDRGGNTFS